MLSIHVRNYYRCYKFCYGPNILVFELLLRLICIWVLICRTKLIICIVCTDTVTWDIEEVSVINLNFSLSIYNTFITSYFDPFTLEKSYSIFGVYWRCYVRNRRSFSCQFTPFVKLLLSLHSIWALLCVSNIINFLVFLTLLRET